MNYFGTVVAVDFEFEVEPGDLPRPLCLIAYLLDERLRHVRTIRLWRGEFSTAPPFDIGADTLVIGYSLWAEMTCFAQLGWAFPKHLFDLHTAYLAGSNVLLPYEPDVVRRRQSKKLPDACRAYGIEGWEHTDKASMAADIGAGRWRIYGKEAVLAYCEEDVKKSVELFICELRGTASRFPPADVNLVTRWSNYSAKVCAQVQAKGMMIDAGLWNPVQENRPAIIRRLLERFDPSRGSGAPIYSDDGEWAYERFEQYLAWAGVKAWPRLDSGQLDISGDAFRLMSHIPGMEGLHALRDSIGVIARAKLPIGSDGRNRPSLFPFCTATGRNAHAKSLFNAHAAMRSFMVFPPDVIGVALDWRTQEVGIAAALSGDPALIEDYQSGDVYHALARLLGLTSETDVERWKKSEPALRQRMKPIQLAINYGMGVPSLAKGIDRHPLVASAIIERHRRRYPRFWEWRADNVKQAMLTRRIETEQGWPLRLSTSPNQRTLFNFPMQSHGAEMLRLAAVRLCEAGLVPSMLVHDAVLLEARSDEEVAHAIEIMRAAGREVCHGFEIGVDIDQELRNGARYQDKRPIARAMWATIMGTLQEVGALPGGGANERSIRQARAV